MKGLLSILLFGFVVSTGLTQDPPKHFRDQDMPFREIDGKVHDFRPMIQWANEYLFLSDHRPQPLEDGTKSDSEIKDWDQRWKKIQKDTAKWEPCLVVGRVVRIRRDGVFLDCGKETRLLTNYPNQKKLKIDDFVECLALPTGTCEFKSSEGAREIAYIFDHGVTPAEPADEMVTAVQVEEPAPPPTAPPPAVKAEPVQVAAIEPPPARNPPEPATTEPPPVNNQPEPAVTANAATAKPPTEPTPPAEPSPAKSPPDPAAHEQTVVETKTEGVLVKIVGHSHPVDGVGDPVLPAVPISASGPPTEEAPTKLSSTPTEATVEIAAPGQAPATEKVETAKEPTKEPEPTATRTETAGTEPKTPPGTVAPPPPAPVLPQGPPPAIAARTIPKATHLPYRLIEGTVYDFRHIIQWAQEYRILAENRPIRLEDGTVVESDIKDWDARWKKIEPNLAKWEPYIVYGKALQVSSDGILVDCGNGRKLVKNHPSQAQLRAGDLIECLARPVGTLPSRNETGDPVTIRIVDHGAAAQSGPNRFVGMSYRVIDGRVMNFHSIIRWANEYEFLQENRPQVLDDGTSVHSSVKNWEQRWQKALEDKLKWQAYFVSGRALGVSKDGLIVDYNGQKIVIKNHPRQALIQPGDPVECVALPMGAMSCVTEEGRRAHVRVFDHGQPLQK